MSVTGEGKDEQDRQHRELNAIRPVLLDVVEQGRRTERRVTEVRDDVELMVKSEMMDGWATSKRGPRR